jgi:hypothetical protein
MVLTSEQAVNTLRKHIVHVSFIKANGEKRSMRCTLAPAYLPKQTDLEEHTNTATSNTVTVWDVDKNGWRKFHTDTILKFEPEV